MPLAPSKKAAPYRRFTDKPELDPSAVWSLPHNHAALAENRTLFPSTVVTVDDSFDDNLLISGENNRKLGKVVVKGKFKGYGLFGLSLEERATCPTDCAARTYCYGNGMQMARRHRIEDLGLFQAILDYEITENIEKFGGILVRLHVLGDFPTVEYVAMWADLLDEFPALACYGYTHRSPSDNIGKAIDALKKRFPDRFRIRWSDRMGPDTAIILNEVPPGPRHNGALVCPAQTDATACCASCGLCWEMGTRSEAIAFIKHGKKSLNVAATAVSESIAPSKRRHIAPIQLPSSCVPKAVLSVAPVLRTVDPKSLLVESDYQRDLSGKSLSLVRKIVSGWDWAKFKPPICSDTGDGLFVIDGQHTAMAAATHPGIKEIPVIVVVAPSIERRAGAFVSHNRDRLTMTAAQVFYGDLASKDKRAQKVMEACVKAGATIPRLPPAKGQWKSGQIAAIAELKDLQSRLPVDTFERILRIAVMSGAAPITKLLLRALSIILTGEEYRTEARASDQTFAGAVRVIGDLNLAALTVSVEAQCSKYHAAATCIVSEFDEKAAAA